MKTYSKGVRVGNVKDHKDHSKQEDINQSWFPTNWTAKDIKRAGEHVAKLKHNRHKGDGIKLYGTWKRVRVVVMRTHGQIGTISPCIAAVSYTHLTLPTKLEWCRSRWSPYH